VINLYNAIIAKYGEIGIKGKNRYIFENKLIKNIRNVLKPMGKFDVYKEYGRIYINLDDYDYEEVIEEVRKVFGIVSVSPVIKIEKDYEKLKEAALKLLEEKVENGAKTFKVESRRGDKEFRLTSQEMNLDIGGYLLSNLGDKVSYSRVNLPSKLRFIAMIPDFEVSTALSRESLPKSYSN